MYIIDAHTGEAHITAPQIGDFNIGIFGSDDCVLNVGEKLRAEIIDANTVWIYDGSIIMQGRRGGISAGGFEIVQIANGTQAQMRNDIIAVKYEKSGSDNTERMSIVTIKGNPGDTAEDPEIPEGDLRNGDLCCYMPLYRVKLDGINLTEIECLFVVKKSVKEMEEEVESLREDIKNIDTTKVGDSTVGGTLTPIYLNKGVPTKCGGTAGSSKTPVYMNAGTLTPLPFKIAAGTKVITTTKGITSAKLFSCDEINTLLGTAYTASTVGPQVFIGVTNGDGSARDAHLIGATMLNGNAYVICDEAWGATANLRVNYILIGF